MSKALEIADQLKKTYTIAHLPSQAAAEFRRLVKLNAQLVAALEEIAAKEWRGDGDPFLDRSRVRSKAREALAKAKEQA